jgi:GAF domain-containing protein
LNAVHPDERLDAERRFTEANEKRIPFSSEYRFASATGEYHWAIDSAQPRFDASGNYLGFIGSVVDIHERKLAEQAIVKAERRAAEEYQLLLGRIVPLAATLGRARDLTTIYRAVRDFLLVSMPCSGFFVSFFEADKSLRHAAYVWGDNEEIDISELPPMELKPEGGGANSRAVYEKRTIIINNYWDEMKNKPHVIVRRDGRDPLSSLIVPMMLKDTVLGTLEVQAYENQVYGQDHAVALEMAANLAAVAIENVRLIETEGAMREAAEAANRAKDEFLSVLSHELRTPLNAMLGWVRMLKADVLDEENTARALEVIERNTRLQSSLIEDLLDVSRIISGKMRIETELVDLVSVVETVSETIRPLAEAKGVLYSFECSDESVFLTADTVRPATGGLESFAELDQVHTNRGRGVDLDRAERDQRDTPCPRYRRRYRGGVAAVHLRSISPSRRICAAKLYRPRSRPDDRAEYRRTSRGTYRSSKRREEQGLSVHPDAAAFS